MVIDIDVCAIMSVHFEIPVYEAGLTVHIEIYM